MSGEHDQPGLPGGRAVAGVGLLMMLCCAGPALIAGGALGVLGGAVGNPWLIAAGALVVAAAVGYTLYRRSRHRTDATDGDRCPPRPPQHRPGSAERPPPRHTPARRSRAMAAPRTSSSRAVDTDRAPIQHQER